LLGLCGFTPIPPVPFDRSQHSGRLPRLAPEYYRGTAWVHFTMCVDQRATGWLDDLHHARLREALVHALSRQHAVCPAYCLMPDHGHFLWTGTRDSSDLCLAARAVRTAWQSLLDTRGVGLQRQPHDHVLREKERERGAVMATARYIFANPERAGLVGEWRDYPFLGAVVPGYFSLDPRDENYWEKFWRIWTNLTR
jgi:REP element-mobilizing transposase RayT